MNEEKATDIKVYVCPRPAGCGYRVREDDVSSILKWAKNDKGRLVPVCNTPTRHINRLMTLESKKLEGLGTLAKEGRAKRRLAEAVARASAAEAEPAGVATETES